MPCIDRAGPKAAGLVTTLRLICRTALPLLLALPFAAAAQEPAAPVSEAPDQIAFSADQLSYDQGADIVTASGAFT